jgi:CubicO group peptidase (beta-lactamase class C family)
MSHSLHSQNSLSGPTLRSIDTGRIVDEVLAEQALAGLALAVVDRNGVVEHVTRGVSAPGRAITRDTVFRIGSVTKTMTAVALLRQWEDGRFDLDDPVNDHLKQLELVGRPGWRPATIRHLLTHTAGIGELASWRDLRRPMFGLGLKVDETPAAAATLYGGRLELDVEPGTKWAYANHGFNVLGDLLESLTGEPFGEHLRANLFNALGMDHTDVRRTDRVRPNLATGYALKRRGLRPARDIDVGTPAAGAVFSTIPDLAAYAAMLLDGGRDILKRETIAMAFEPHYRPCATHPGIGLSFFRDTRGDQPIVGHGGDVPGFSTALLLAPGEGVGVVACVNNGHPAVGLAAHRVLCALLGVEARPPRRTPLRPERWGDLVGRYRPDPGALTNARMLYLGAVRLRIRRRRLELWTPAAWLLHERGFEMLPADDDGRIYMVDAQRFGVPPLAVHVEPPSDAQPTTIHLGGLTVGAFPALRRRSSRRANARL